MPFVNIKIARDGATVAQKKRLISGVTQLLAEILGKDPQRTLVMIEEMDADNIGLGGITVAESKAKQKVPD